MTFHKMFYLSLTATYVVSAFVVDYFYEQPKDLGLNILGGVFMLMAVGLAWLNYWISKEEP
jgi:biotin transporter BioY